MKKYIGTKQVKAEKCTLGEYMNRSGKCPLPNEEETKEGYIVEYPDGYISWSPAEVFEKAYHIAETFTDRLRIELKELSERFKKANDFINNSIKFRQLSSLEQSLLQQQVKAMDSYGTFLSIRLNYYVEKTSKPSYECFNRACTNRCPYQQEEERNGIK